MHYAIGIDIGGSSTKFGITDKEGNIIEQNTLPTTSVTSCTDLIQSVRDNIQTMTCFDDINKDIIGIGVGAPNANFFTGAIENAVNLPRGDNVPLKKIIETITHHPCYVTNDANAATLGEYIWGKGNNYTDFLLLTLGTGVGSGIIVNRNLVYGFKGMAGELGHTTVIPNGRIHPSTGLSGSLEMYCSTQGILTTAYELSTQYPSNQRIQGPRHTQTIATLAHHASLGDPFACHVFTYTGEILGTALANFVHFSAPHIIFLAGGIAQSGDILLKPTQIAMNKNLLPVFRGHIDIEVTGWAKSEGAILGASSLVFHYGM